MSDPETQAEDKTSEQEVQKEAQKTEPPIPTKGDSSNGLSLQLEEKIIRQVEYYFGDRNLPRDKFLQSAAAESDGGWVPILTLLTFNRLKALSSDADYIINALRKSSGNILEINSEGTAVRRCPDNPPVDIFSPEQRRKIKDKTVYVKGFDEEEKLDEIQLFLDNYGKLEHVQMRKKKTDRIFKGSIFAEFKEKEMAETFLGLPALEFKGKELIKESKEAYFQRKAEKRKELKREEVEAATVAATVKTKGAILFFKGPELKTSREDIKEVMQEFATVAFVDFERGAIEGHIRFQEENGAKKVMEGLTAAAPEGGTPQLCGADIEMEVLEGDEEVEYWTKARSSRAKSKGGRRGRGGYHSYGAGGDRKRKQKFKDGPVAKQPKQQDESEEQTGTNDVTETKET